jgi:DNA-binding NtrC family response regulator
VLAPPSLSVSTPVLEFEQIAGAADPAAQTVTITNAGDLTISNLVVGPISYGSGEPSGWLSATASGATTPVTVTIQPTGAGSAVQERRFERVGGTRTIEVDVRWIAATNRSLDDMMRAGAFREDRYHRLAVFPIELPPLRDRTADIAPLAETLLARIGADLGRPLLRLDDEAVRRIRTAVWPGNVRELANTLERAAILAEGDIIRGANFAPQQAGTATGRDEVRTMHDIERDAIRAALDDVGGHRRLAAERLGIGVRTLYEKLKKYGID